MFTVFIESNAPTAKADLESLRKDLAGRAGMSRLTLLEGLERGGLYLLVCECEAVPEGGWPEGSRVWTFRRVSRGLSGVE